MKDKQNIIKSSANIYNAIKQLNKSKIKTLIVLKKNKFIGTVTDGDIRRGLLKKIDLNSNISKILNKNALTTKKKTLDYNLKKKINEKKIDCLPILTSKNIYAGYHTLDEETKEGLHDTLFCLMAGGRGTRLMPLTAKTPKPLVNINKKPIIVHILNKIFKEGFHKVLVTTHYKSKMIIKYLNNLKLFKNKIEFFIEKKPLGTAGALSNFKRMNYKYCIISNADIITGTNYLDIVEYHKLNQADITITTFIENINSSYGNLSLKGKRIKKINEKPSYVQNISIGIYVVNTSLLKYLKKDKYCDMPNFVNELIKKNKKVLSFPIHERWVDIGNISSLKKARKIFK